MSENPIIPDEWPRMYIEARCDACGALVFGELIRPAVMDRWDRIAATWRGMLEAHRQTCRPPAPLLVHILNNKGYPYCGRQLGGFCHGGLNSASCRVCIAGAAGEPDAPPKCAACGYYHTAAVADLFHLGAPVIH